MGRRRNMITAEARSRGENQEPVFAIAATEESWWPSVADSRDARRCDLVSPLPGLNILFITLSQPLRAGLPLCRASRRWTVEEDAVSWLPETFSTELPAGDEPSEAPAFATASRRWSVEEDAVSSLPLASSRDPPCGRNFEEPVSGFLRVSVSPW